MSLLVTQSLLDNDPAEEYGRKAKELGKKLDKFVDYTISVLSTGTEMGKCNEFDIEEWAARIVGAKKE